MAASLLNGKESLDVFPTTTHAFYSSPGVLWRFGTQLLAAWNKSSEVMASGVSGKEAVIRVKAPLPSNPAKASASSG